MTYFIKHLLTSIFLILMVQNLWAQNTCTEQLRLAQRRYDGGMLDEIPNIISPCLRSGFTKEEKVTAYKLLIQTYLFSERIDEADAMMLQFLNDFPEYRLAPNDHKEFITLYRSYRTDPIMKIEGSLGTNFSLTTVSEYYGPEDLNTSQPKYTSNIGLNAEVNYINKLFNNFDGSFGLSFNYLRIGYENIPFEFTTISASYANVYVGLPMAMRYNMHLMKLNLFAKAGIEPVFLLSSSINFSRERVGSQDPISGNENVISLQKRIDIRPMLSIGINYRVGTANLMLTTGIKFGTLMPTKSDKRYSNQDLYQKYYFIPDDFLVHQAFVNVSYIFSIYKPKKIM
jgi:hypothetical protein